jgi:hypothetical protein
VSEQSRDRSLARPRLAKTVMTLAAWLVAFAVVMALLTLLGDELASLPLALRALVISGVLVSLMANLVMPILNSAIARWLSGGPINGTRRERPRADVARAEAGERSQTGDSPLEPRKKSQRANFNRPQPAAGSGGCQNAVGARERR